MLFINTLIRNYKHMLLFFANDQRNCSFTEMFASLLALIKTASITAVVNKATSQSKQPRWSELKPSTCRPKNTTVIYNLQI